MVRLFFTARNVGNNPYSQNIVLVYSPETGYSGPKSGSDMLFFILHQVIHQLAGTVQLSFNRTQWGF